MRQLFVIVFLLSSLLFSRITQAETTLIDDQFTEMQHETFEAVQGNILSPFCPGRLLKDCPSSAARDLKYEIKERILKGDNEKVILADLIKEYGEDMRASPKGEGIGLLAWGFPFLFLFIGFIGILAWVHSQRSGTK